MGNRYTKEPSITRDDPSKTFRFPDPKMTLFVACAKAEGVSLNVWMLMAGEAWAATSRDRVRAIKDIRSGKTPT